MRCTAEETNFARKMRIVLTVEMLPHFWPLDSSRSRTRLVKNSESDGAGYGSQRGDEAVVPVMIDVQDGIADRPLGVIDLSFHVDASFRKHPVYGEQHSGNVPMNVYQPVIAGIALELAVWQIHAKSGVAGL